MTNENIWENIPTKNKYKKRILIWDYECSICSSNSRDWWILYDDYFTSWVLEPPAHKNCDCELEIKSFIWKVEKTIDNKKEKDILTKDNHKTKPEKIIDIIGEVTKDIHYSRNDFNTNLPKNKNEAEKRWWVLLNRTKSVFHNSNAPFWEFNYKFISPDGHKEAVYHYKTGEIITSPEDMWTYNFYSPLDSPWNHISKEVSDYILHWNSLDDPTTKIERIAKLWNIIPALGLNLYDYTEEELTEIEKQIKYKLIKNYEK